MSKQLVRCHTVYLALLFPVRRIYCKSVRPEGAVPTQGYSRPLGQQRSGTQMMPLFRATSSLTTPLLRIIRYGSSTFRHRPAVRLFRVVWVPLFRAAPAPTTPLLRIIRSLMGSVSNDAQKWRRK